MLHFSEGRLDNTVLNGLQVVRGNIDFNLTFLKPHTISPTKTGSALSGQIPRAMGLLERACAI